MINLFNIDIKKIRYDGANIKLIKLGDTIIYEAPISYGVYEPYQFRDDTQLTEVDTIVNESHDNLSYMFSGCTNLTYANIEEFNTSNVTDMQYMFDNCDSLTKLNLSNFDTRKVTNMDKIFNSCYSLTELDLSNFNTKRCSEGNSSTGYRWLMSNCPNLYTLRLDNCNRFTINFILTWADIARGNQYNPPEKLGTIYCKRSMAEGLTLPYGWEFNYIVEDSSTELRLYNDIADEFRGSTTTEVRTIVNNSHTDLSDMFDNCTNLTSVNTQDWDTSNVTDMSWMFYCCYSLTSLDVNKWITNNVSDMGDMFDGCSSLTSLDLSSFDTGKVTNMEYMFYGCYKLDTLDIRNFNIDESVNVDKMLSGCTSLHILHLDNCSKDTINKIISSSNFPTGTINGKTRTIYCSADVIAELEELEIEAPTNWIFATA